MKYAIGIDIGGTKISVILGNDKGKILASDEFATRKGVQTRYSVKQIQEITAKVIEMAGIPKKKVLGIGVGIPGPVNTKTGIVPQSPHLDGWKDIPLAKILSQFCKLPVYMTNDANAAALGEKAFGQGKKLNNFVYMTVSTGIGGGIIVNGTLLEGASYVAGEVGHMTIVPEGDLCKCGKQGCLEAYASGTAIATYAESQIAKGRKSVIGTLKAANESITARIVGLAAKQDDALALESYQRSGSYLGIGIANLLNILNPEKIILGGGVLKSAPGIFWQAMYESCQCDAWPEAMRAVKIVRSKLRGHVGDLGAMALVFEKSMRP